MCETMWQYEHLDPAPVDEAEAFFESRQKWSFETFGPPEERNGVGPMAHLQKEIYEVFKAMESMEHCPCRECYYNLLEELVDCRFLLEDAVSREGFSYEKYMDMSWKKLDKNMKRKWGTPSADGIVEHIRE